MSEAPDVEKQSLHWDKDGQNRLHENINLSLRHQIPFHPKKKALRSDAGLHLIWPNSSRRILDCVIVIQIALFAFETPFFLSSPPIKKDDQKGSPWHPWKTPRAQTPPPLRSTVTGPRSSRVSSADFIRMARRLSDTWPFFTALISCTGNRAECQITRPGRRTVKIPTIQGFRASEHLHIPEL